jgi:N-acetylglucosamine-6-phosphate deacetylase
LPQYCRTPLVNPFLGPYLLKPKGYTVFDLHIHGLGDYDSRGDSVQEILSIAGLLGKRGIKGFLPTLYPAPIDVMRRQMAVAAEAKRGQDSAQAEVLGVHLEGPFLNPSRAGALDKASFLPATEYNLQCLLDGFYDLVKVITIAPEIEGATSLIRQIANKGIVVSLGHSDATYSQAEEAYHAGAKGITHLFNAMRGIHHREPGLAGFGLLHRDIYVELIADPFHLHPLTLEMVFRLKPIERIILVSDAVKGAGADPRGAITDHSGTLLGGAYTLDSACSRLIDMGLADEATLQRLTRDNPTHYLSA